MIFVYDENRSKLKNKIHANSKLRIMEILVPKVGDVVHLPLQKMLELERILNESMFLVFSKAGNKYKGVVMGHSQRRIIQLGPGQSCNIL